MYEAQKEFRNLQRIFDEKISKRGNPYADKIKILWGTAEVCDGSVYVSYSFEGAYLALARKKSKPAKSILYIDNPLKPINYGFLFGLPNEETTLDYTSLSLDNIKKSSFSGIVASYDF